MLAPTDYEITEAENGEQALTAVAKQRPDLILMAIQLPIMDGYEVTRQSRKKKGPPFSGPKVSSRYKPAWACIIVAQPRGDREFLLHPPISLRERSKT